MSQAALHLTDADATEALGLALAATLPTAPMVVFLEGELGAGKSSLARSLLRGLGVDGPIPSPTYTLIEPYRTSAGELLHLDLYRLAGPDELEFLALDEHVGRARLWLVEWASRGEGALPTPDLRLRLAFDGRGRRVEAESGTAAAAAWWKSAVAHLRG